MYPATDHLPADATRSEANVDWYVRKFRLETAEAALGSDAIPEVPEVRSRKWLVVVVTVVMGVSGLLALATFLIQR
jgi:hypothetical protein